MTNDEFSKNAEIFAIYTQMYIRMRRVLGRVIDAAYMVENPQYAAHIIALAKDSQDLDLLSLVQQLQHIHPEEVEQACENQTLIEDRQPTEEEIYQSQVPHHYIGYLR